MNLYDLAGRDFLAALGASAYLFTVPGAFAAELTRTPDQTKGPFYPDKMPLDTDNDLLIINDRITPAVGEISHVSGRVLDLKGQPIRNAVVEIWQCDANGAYLHPRSDNRKKADGNFQGFGRFLTNGKGEYYFRTIKPVPYPGRTPHIHFRVLVGRKELLATQMYVKGHPQNARDGIFTSVPAGPRRDALVADFVPIKGSKLKELQANWDIVVGVTPAA